MNALGALLLGQEGCMLQGHLPGLEAVLTGS